MCRCSPGRRATQPPHFHPNDRYIYVLEGTWWVGTGNKFDPDNLTVPMKAGTYVTHFAKGVHWDGAKADEDATSCSSATARRQHPGRGSEVARDPCRDLSSRSVVDLRT